MAKWVGAIHVGDSTLRESPRRFLRRKKKTMGLSVEEKIKKYISFWNGYPVERPMVGFSLGGWFSFQSYSAIQKYRGVERLTPDMLSPEIHFGDYDRIVAPFEEIEDDVIHSVAPIPLAGGHAGNSGPGGQ
jgi:hypothetical protein